MPDPEPRRIVYMPLEEILPAPRNAKRHADLDPSFDQFGYLDASILDERTGQLIGGHGRIEKLISRRALGKPAPEGVVVDGDVWRAPVQRGWSSRDDQHAERAGIALNRYTELGGWDTALLAEMLDPLAMDDALLAAVGFDDATFADLMASLSAPPSGDDGAQVAASLSLAERFVVPPFSVLDARQGYWQDRKRQWLALGIQSELGRGDIVPSGRGADGRTVRGDGVGRMKARPPHGPTVTQAADGTLHYRPTNAGDGEHSGTSVFDPVLCELAYRWFCPPEGVVLDPFAGGSVRGIVASRLGRGYVGVDLSGRQLDANRAQAATIVPDRTPTWIEGDSVGIADLAPGAYDLVFSCPPYADLEVYSDDPADISAMPYDEFLAAYRRIIAASVGLLRDDRFACFVVGDIRDRRGLYRNFVSHTIDAFADVGAALYNEAILVTSVGSLSIRVGRQFSAGRKLGKTHQNVLTFVKGDPKKATEACGPVEVADIADPDSDLV